MMENEQRPAQADHKVQPVIIPDAFSGKATESWDNWLGHFDSVARVNGWDENTYLLWLEEQLTGNAHNAWRRLSYEPKHSMSPQRRCSESSLSVNCTWLNFEPELSQHGES